MSLYNIDLLEIIVERDNCQIDIESIDFEKLRKQRKSIRIPFICQCTELGEKIFQSIYKNGAFCHECAQKNRATKIQARKTDLILNKDEIGVMKICYQCNSKKLIEEFSKDMTRKDNLRSQCKDCDVKHNNYYKQTFDGAMHTLFYTSIINAQHRIEKKRIEAG